MDTTTGATTPIWLDTVALEPKPTLPRSTQADVCIVGAGIAGLTTAYLLAREGRSIIVVDDGAVGSGETSRTTAHLVTALDDRYFDLERLHGETGARLAAESHTRAIEMIESIARDEAIACEFERLDGYLFVQKGEDPADLDREREAALRARLDVELLPRVPGLEFNTGPCLRFARQAQFHPMRYLDGLVRAIEARGGRVYGRSHVTTFEDGSPCRIETSDGSRVTADVIVVATNTPVNDRVTIHTKQAAYRTYVVGLAVQRDLVPRALYWDTGDPYHYVRLARGAGGEDVLIVGGEDHKTGQADDAEERFARLIGWSRGRFPTTNRVVYRWSGQVMEPIDSLAFIGRNPGDRHTYIATGDSGNGMTHGTIAGLLLTDLIAGRDNPWATLYDPARISLRAAPEFAKENLNVAVQYADLLSPGDVSSPEEIAPGTGAIVREGLKPVAVYRDENGRVHRYSALCPHLGCVVEWNRTEKTWDCPCHGSRFDPHGQVLNGPAVSALGAVEP
jgi:glycine/D-amino acid oxidase-like deaminating enzyme/nitrite reductase/ring-hydroxylating ferredoxin subunit